MSSAGVIVGSVHGLHSLGKVPRRSHPERAQQEIDGDNDARSHHRYTACRVKSLMQVSTGEPNSTKPGDSSGSLAKVQAIGNEGKGQLNDHSSGKVHQITGTSIFENRRRIGLSNNEQRERNTEHERRNHLDHEQ